MTMTVTLSSKGQVVIPKPLREALGLKKGTRFHVHLAANKIILEPTVTSPVVALYGKYAGTNLLAELEMEHRQELRDDSALRP